MSYTGVVSAISLDAKKCLNVEILSDKCIIEEETKYR